jgi:hypothetical protein
MLHDVEVFSSCVGVGFILGLLSFIFAEQEAEVRWSRLELQAEAAS